MTTTTSTSTSDKSKTRKSVSPAKREELDNERRAEVEGLLGQITEAVTRLHTEPGWQALLTAAARLHTYSFGNQILIALACPGAQAVAGYRAWQALGRNVRKGERGIRILRPITRTIAATDAADDRRSEVETAAAAAAGRKRVVGFGGVSVFEIGQTDGPPVPDLRIVPLEGDAPAGVLDALTAHVTALGWTLTYRNTGPAEALANFRTKEIACSETRPGAHTIVSLAHEIAHVHLHDPEGFDYARCRGQAEIEAESVAFIVATALGVEAAAPGSATYIAAWAKGDNKKVRAAAERVTTTARTMLAALTPTTGQVNDNAGQEAPA